MYLCERWAWACMWLHPLECTRACDCARRRCGLPHHVRAWVRPPGYIANAHVTRHVQDICIHRCKVRVCKWVRVCVLAYACDRMRALTMREYAACVRVRRALFVTPSIDGTCTGIVNRCMMHACIYIHARLATQMNGSPMRARRTHAPACCVCARARVCVRVLARKHPRRHMRAPSVGVDRVWLASQAFGTDYGTASAFNANIGAWNTASVSNMQSVCAAFSARRRATAGGTRSAGRRCGAGRCARRRRRRVRARVCADVWARVCTDVHVCRYSCA
jgi:hypothetical protein